MLVSLLESAHLPCVFSLPSAFRRGGRQRGALPSAADGKDWRTTKVTLPSVFLYTHGKQDFVFYFFIHSWQTELCRLFFNSLMAKINFAICFYFTHGKQ